MNTSPATTPALRGPLLAASACLALAIWAPAFAATDPSREFLDNARQRLEQGDVRAAIIQLRNAVQADPANLEAREALGRLYLQVGELEAAEKELRLAHAGSPTDANEILLGQALLALNRPEQTLQIVGTAAGDPAIARQKALLRTEALLNLGRLDEAAALLASPPVAEVNDATGRLLLARLKAGQGDLPAARAAVDAALVLAPDLATGWLLAAQVNLAAGSSEQATKAARRALELAPGNAQAQLLLGEIALRRGDLQEAEAQVAAVRAVAPSNVLATYLLANIQAARGDYSEADRTLRQVADQLRDYPPALLLSGSLKARTGQLAQAQDLLGRYLALVPSDRAARRLLAAAQLDGGQARAATDTLLPMITPQSQDVAGLQLLASAQLRANDLAGARASFARLAAVGQPAERQQAQSFVALLDRATADTDNQRTKAILLVLDDLRRARLDESLQQAEDLVASAPRDPEVLNLLGAVLLARGEDARAREQLEAALAVDPSFQGARDNLDRLDIRAGEQERVEDRLRARLREVPDDEAAALRLAALLASRQDLAGAQAVLHEKAEVLPNSVAIRLALASLHNAQGETDRLLAVAKELEAIGAAGNASGLEAAGNLYLAASKPGQAAAAFASLAQSQPDNVAVKLLLARAQYVAGDKSGARATLEQARQLAPGNVIVNNSLVDLDLEAGQADQALGFARGIGAIDAVQSAQLEAKVLLASKRGAEAVDILARSVASNPNAGTARALFAARRQIGEEDAAIAGLRAWVVANPDDAASLDVLSQAMIRKGDYVGAAAIAEQAAQLVPSNPAILNNLAWLRHELDRAGAEQLARQAHQLAPSSPEIADTLGWILVRTGKADEGLALLREADEATQHRNPDIRYHLAYALQATGDAAGAKTILKELMDVEQPFLERQAAEALMTKLGRS